MSATELQKRNLFLTQILKGKISRQHIQELEKMEQTSVKFNELENESRIEDDDIEMYEVDMKKKKSNNRLVERNMVEASGQVYRDCDYLSEEYKQRL